MFDQIRSIVNSARIRINKAFSAPSLAELIQDERQKAVLEKYHAERTIHHHRFTVHMAAAKIAALDAWSKK